MEASRQDRLGAAASVPMEVSTEEEVVILLEKSTPGPLSKENEGSSSDSSGVKYLLVFGHFFTLLTSF